MPLNDLWLITAAQINLYYLGIDVARVEAVTLASFIADSSLEHNQATIRNSVLFTIGRTCLFSRFISTNP